MFFIIVAACHASGTFIMPPPPVKKVVLNPEHVKLGAELVKKVSQSGNNCLSCHSKGQSHEFKRRSLGGIFGQLHEKINLCWMDGSRMGEQQEIAEDSLVMQAFRTWLASEFRLEDQMARGGRR